MGFLRLPRLSAGLVLLSLLVVAPLVGRSAPPSKKRIPIVVVVGAESNLRDISMASLRYLYRGEVSRSARIPFHRPTSSEERRSFDKQLLGLNPQQAARYWIDRKIRGHSGSPRSLGTSIQVSKVVARFPKAIGYMRADQLPSWIRPLRIDGKRHTAPDYPLFIEVSP